MERDEARRGCGDEQAGEWVFVRVEVMLLVELQCGFVFAVVAMSDMGGVCGNRCPGGHVMRS
jgi:hypothetical protein